MPRGAAAGWLLCMLLQFMLLLLPLPLMWMLLSLMLMRKMRG